MDNNREGSVFVVPTEWSDSGAADVPTVVGLLMNAGMMLDLSKPLGQLPHFVIPMEVDAGPFMVGMTCRDFTEHSINIEVYETYTFICVATDLTFRIQDIIQQVPRFRYKS